MAKSKKITFNMIASDMKKNEEHILNYIIGDKEYAIPVKERLELGDALGFIQMIVDMCADIDEGRYSIESYDFAVMLATLVYYAGFDMPKDAVKAYSVLVGTDIYDRVCEMINADQHVDLIGAAMKKIDFAREMIVSEHASRVNELISKMDETLVQGKEIVDMVNDGRLDALVGELAKIEGGAGDGAEDNIAK